MMWEDSLMVAIFSHPPCHLPLPILRHAMRASISEHCLVLLSIHSALFKLESETVAPAPTEEENTKKTLPPRLSPAA